MSGKALTDGEYRELLGCVFEGIPNREELVPDAVRAHLGAKTISHEALRLMLGVEPQRAVELLAATPATTPAVITAPAGLLAILESQADRLMGIGAFGEAKVSKGKYRDELMATAKAFVWRPELAAIGLTEVALIDYRLRGQFLAEAGSVYCYIEPDRCKNFKGIVTPDGVLVIQAQWGLKYRNKKPVWCRSNFHILEQGGVVKEGLTAYLYGGEKLLKECYMDLPGSVSGVGRVPCLRWCGGRPLLLGVFGDGASPRFGSVSRGSVVVTGTV
jgi:hypothetical protein